MQPLEVFKLYNQAEQDCKAQVKVGKVFNGAMKAASKRGYTYGSEAYQVYVWAYLKHLPGFIYLDEKGVITSIE